MLIQRIEKSRVKKLVQYTKEVFLGTYVPVILSVPVGMSIVLILGPSRRHLANIIINSPYFVLQITIAAVGAFLFRRRTCRRLSVWVWIPPAFILTWNVFTWYRYPGQEYWKDVWDNFFGSHCGSYECLYELGVTAPFYCSLAYSLVAAILRPNNSSEDSNASQPVH